MARLLTFKGFCYKIDSNVAAFSETPRIEQLRYGFRFCQTLGSGLLDNT
jgi:hypothetical protein